MVWCAGVLVTQLLFLKSVWQHETMPYVCQWWFLGVPQCSVCPLRRSVVVKQYWGSLRSALHGSEMPSDRVTAVTYLEADLSANHQDCFFHLGFRADMKNGHSPESLFYPGLIKFVFLQFLCNKVIDRMDGHKSSRLGNQAMWHSVANQPCLLPVLTCVGWRLSSRVATQHTGWAGIGHNPTCRLH